MRGSASASLRRESDNFADDVIVETSPEDRATPPDYRSPISVVPEQNRGRVLIGAPTISIKRDNMLARLQYQATRLPAV